jgi:hypothetical protein
VINSLTVATGALLKPIKAVNVAANGLLKAKDLKDSQFARLSPSGALSGAIKEREELLEKIKQENEELIMVLASSVAAVGKISS